MNDLLVQLSVATTEHIPKLMINALWHYSMVVENSKARAIHQFHCMPSALSLTAA